MKNRLRDVVKVSNVVYDEKPLQQAVSQEKKLYGIRMNKGTTMLEHLNSFNKVNNELLAVDVKIH